MRWQVRAERNIFILTKKLVMNKYMIYDLESDDKDDIDNLINDSDTEVIAEEEITQAASTQVTVFDTNYTCWHFLDCTRG